MSDQDDGVRRREARLRRTVRKYGYRLEKTPSRHWSRSYYGPGYMLTDDTNTVRWGCNNREYELSLGEVEAIAGDFR